MNSCTPVERCDCCSEPLEASQIGKCGNCLEQDAGWFDVDGYKTPGNWHSSANATSSETGFSTLAEATQYAQSDAFSGFYQVAVIPRGPHDDYEVGKPVFYKNPHNVT